MRRLTLTALAVALCLPATVAAAAPKTPTPVRVDGGAKLTWVRRPDAMKMNAIANDYGAGRGRGIVECTLSAGGRPEDCTVVEAEGNSYGPMMIKLATLYRAASKDADGAASAGVKIRLTLEGRGANTF